MIQTFTSLLAVLYWTTTIYGTKELRNKKKMETPANKTVLLMTKITLHIGHEQKGYINQLMMLIFHVVCGHHNRTTNDSE